MSHTVTLPVNNGTKIYALLNDDGSRIPPLQYPITTLDEIAYTNNVDTITVCVDDQPTLQALKYTTTPTAICDSILMYTIDVCNIGSTDATGVVVNDIAPEGAILTGMIVNDNDCSIDNGDSYDIPSECCVSLSLTYNVAGVAVGYYPQQNVALDGPEDQVYIDYDGSLSSAEDVFVTEEEENCPSTEITISKAVSEDEICDDGFLVYTITIHNETSSVIHGARFFDVLPSPMKWVYKPYALSGLSISTQELTGRIADFTIDEIQADTVATFQLDAYTGTWSEDGTVSTSAVLENVVDLDNGGLQTIAASPVSTTVYASADYPCQSLWTTNTEDIDAFSSVILYPNPSEGTIKFKNLTESVEYKLFSYTGILYDEGEYSGGELQLDYDGINIVMLILDGEIKTYKVLRL